MTMVIKLLQKYQKGSYNENKTKIRYYINLIKLIFI